MENEQYEGSDLAEPVVVVKPKAYLKMMKHVLRFGSMAKDKSQFRECMGMLMGRLGNKKGIVNDIIVTDAVCVTNGSHIEVSFDDMDYVNFADINAEYAEKGAGEFNIGWYHSHPGLTVFLSTVDVQNHLGFQTTNPSAIAIVWDHLLLEQENEKGEYDHGFETFRLTEIGKGRHSDYATVKTIVETPKDLSFYKTAIKEIIDLQHAGHPPILEISELPSIVGDFEPKPVNEKDFDTRKINIETKPGEQISIGQLSSDFVKPLNDFLNQWSNSISASVKNQNVLLYRNVKKLKNSIESKMEQTQKWFKERVNEIFYDIWADSDTILEEQINKITPTLQLLQEKITGKIDDSADLDDIISKLNEQINSKQSKVQGGGN